MNPEDFRLDVLQAAIWIQGFEPSTRRLLALASGDWAVRFDGEPTILPEGVGLPPDVARVAIASTDRHWRVQVAPARVDLFWERQSAASAIDTGAFAVVTTETFLQFLALSPDIRITRLAYVCHRGAPVANPGGVLSRYFVRSALREEHGPLNRPFEFQIHAHKVYQPNELPRLNSWVRWRAGTLLHHDHAPGVALQQDLNTVADGTVAFQPDQVRTFFERIPTECDAVLSLYLSRPPED